MLLCIPPTTGIHETMKRTAIKRRPLADTVLQTLEPEEKKYREAYGVDRLYFVVTPSGSKRWEVRYKSPITGRWAWTGVGSYPDTTAKRARLDAQRIATLVADGIDPIAPEIASEALTFSVVAEAWYQDKIDRGRAQKTLDSIRYWLNNDALPAIGEKPIDQISRGDCSALQQSIEDRQAYNTAEKSRSWLNQVYGRAIALGYTENNPASNLADIAAEAPSSTPYPHLLEPELPAFLCAVQRSAAGVIVKTAGRLVVRTASRPGMIRWMEWAEVDGDLWRIPGEKMKMRNDHVVPLTRQDRADIEALRAYTGRSQYLFPGSGPKNPVISDNTINKHFSSVGYKRKMTGHGSRHTAKTLLSEHGWPSEWTEAMLAHTKEGLEAVYNQAQYLKRRRAMMQWYADYLDALERGMEEGERETFASRVIEGKS